MADKELAGRVAFVTGAGRNIGRAIAITLADGGAAVAVNARSNRAEAEAVVKAIEAAGGRAIAVIGDVTDEAAVAAMVAETAKQLGPINILVNNAALRAEKSLEDMSLKEWQEFVGVILDGAFICVKACLPQMKASGGAIVNVGGMSAHTGAAKRPHVVTAKAGLVGFTRALAHELAPYKIRVNTVTPGQMVTPRPAGQPEPNHHSFAKPLVGRRGEPEDIAAAVRFVAGPGASFVTGQNFQINGGAFLG